MRHLDRLMSDYGPIYQKSFSGALDAFFQQECPHLGGVRTRQLLVQAISQMVEAYFPKSERLHKGQIMWVAVAKEEKTSFNKRMQDTRQVPVILDLVLEEDALAVCNGKSFQTLREETIARLHQQAFDQGGCLAATDLAIILKLNPTAICLATRNWEKAHDAFLPHRGVIHDLGRTLTHKRQIVRKLFLEGKTVEDVCQETRHSPQAVHRYIMNFKQVLLCHRKGLDVDQTAFAIRMSPSLVREYHGLIRDLAKNNHALEGILTQEPLP